MDRLTCDRCGNGLLLDAPVRYEVRIEVKSAYDPMELTEDDLANASENLKKAIDQVTRLSPDEAMDEVYKEFRFDLCRTCQKAFLKAPLGAPRSA
ncbi:MAG TPA: hypothetical protein VKW04_10975 [Planctomycetota bacterium]|nr:hypothetical protein [Planctomycetota bacterium]